MQETPTQHATNLDLTRGGLVRPIVNAPPYNAPHTKDTQGGLPTARNPSTIVQATTNRASCHRF